MVAIITRFYGPTNTRGARIAAWRGDDPKIRVYVPYDYAGTTESRHRLAALTLADRFDWLTDGMTLIGGSTDNGYAFVFASDRILQDARNASNIIPRRK